MVFTGQDISPLDIPLGSVLRLPCKFIKGKSNAHPIAINAIAQQLAKTQRNMLPIVVRLLDEDDYQAIVNTQILDGARQAKLDFVWCIVVDKEMQARVEVETGQVVRANVISASEKELAEILEFMKANVAGFSRIDPKKISAAIVTYRDSHLVKNLNFLTKARCGIGRTKVSKLSEFLIID